MSWSQNGTLITRKVPPDQAQPIAQLTNNYRKFRSLRRSFLALDHEIRETLRLYEMALIGQARRPFDFLAHAPKNATRTPKRRQKRRKPRRGPSK
jgi:hypothetical protein